MTLKSLVEKLQQLKRELPDKRNGIREYYAAREFNSGIDIAIKEIKKAFGLK
jgi:hypothetical protein